MIDLKIKGINIKQEQTPENEKLASKNTAKETIEHPAGTSIELEMIASHQSTIGISNEFKTEFKNRRPRQTSDSSGKDELREDDTNELINRADTRNPL